MDLTNAILVTTQVLILFLMIGAGFVARKVKLVEENGLRQMANLLLVVITPCVIVNAFQTPYDPAMMRGLLISLGIAIATHVIGALIGRMLFRDQPAAQAKVLRFAIVFTNCGYFCLPLLDAVVGTHGVFYGSVFIAVFNIACWTYGVLLMTGGQEKINLRHAFVNPGTIAVLISLPIYLFQLRLPSILHTVIGQMAAINSPLAMLIIGGQLATIPLRELFLSRQVYIASIFRLLVVPLIVLIILNLLPLDREIVLSGLLPAAAPTAAATALFASRHDQDVGLATHIIAFSTLFCIVTIPLLIVLSDFLGSLF